MPRVRHAAMRGVREVLVADANAGEAAACGVESFGFGSLRGVVDHLEGRARVAPTAVPPRAAAPRHPVDLGHIAGQETPKRALEIAAAGGHNLLFVGPPGTGKPMLARALESILPPLDDAEALAASAVRSVAGLTDPRHPILTARPFGAPHHTASHLSLVGGGSPPRPGEVSLAHCGALFLDELAEFSPHVLETLREPLEECAVTISRAGGAATYPARFVLVAARNPCPRGHLGDTAGGGLPGGGRVGGGAGAAGAPVGRGGGAGRGGARRPAATRAASSISRARPIRSGSAVTSPWCGSEP